ncbi:hypothetical protein OPV22_026800 [Ensete ventricosum]|uniref:Uncharacterized protein n=1 Tax=Ensete ventricosum TaxID=4639 RepID=A0AAV8Q254_ENSVE|nr:hypothetical protein OPV22_026800 [Ensete ventricosum]
MSQRKKKKETTRRNSCNLGRVAHLLSCRGRGLHFGDLASPHRQTLAVALPDSGRAAPPVVPPSDLDQSTLLNECCTSFGFGAMRSREGRGGWLQYKEKGKNKNAYKHIYFDQYS